MQSSQLIEDLSYRIKQCEAGNVIKIISFYLEQQENEIKRSFSEMEKDEIYQVIYDYFKKCSIMELAHLSDRNSTNKDKNYLAYFNDPLANLMVHVNENELKDEFLKHYPLLPDISQDSDDFKTTFQEVLDQAVTYSKNKNDCRFILKRISQIITKYFTSDYGLVEINKMIKITLSKTITREKLEELDPSFIQSLDPKLQKNDK